LATRAFVTWLRSATFSGKVERTSRVDNAAIAMIAGPFCTKVIRLPLRNGLERRLKIAMSRFRKDPQRVAEVVHRNIKELCDHRQRHERKLSVSERIANKVAQFTGTTAFLYINAAFFFLWITLNMHAFGLKPFDPFPFGMLTTVVSLEAIFLSLFVLLSQNRMQKLADQQSELDLQINLLAEHELTRILVAVHMIAEKMELELPHKEEKEELESDVAPNVVLDEIEKNNET
jgi:uncharacterized membrane protein